MEPESENLLTNVDRDVDVDKIMRGRIKALYTEASRLDSIVMFNLRIALFGILFILCCVVTIIIQQTVGSNVGTAVGAFLTIFFLFITIMFSIEALTKHTALDKILYLISLQEEHMQRNIHRQTVVNPDQGGNLQQQEIPRPSIMFGIPGGVHIPSQPSNLMSARNLLRLLSPRRHNLIPINVLWSARSSRSSRGSVHPSRQEPLPDQAIMPDNRPVVDI